MSSQAISNNIHTPNSSCFPLLKNTQSKIFVIFILSITLILIVMTALSLPSITPIWSPLIPLGVVIIAIVIFCILSKSSSVTKKKETEKKVLEKTSTPRDKPFESSQPSTRQNSLSSLLNENEWESIDNASFSGKDSLKKSPSVSSLDSILSSALQKPSFSSRKKIPSYLEDEDS